MRLFFVQQTDQIISYAKIIFSVHHLSFQNAPNFLNWIEIRVLWRPHIKDFDTSSPLSLLCIGPHMAWGTSSLRDITIRHAVLNLRMEVLDQDVDALILIQCVIHDSKGTNSLNSKAAQAITE
jgi:hypothetical protein